MTASLLLISGSTRPGSTNSAALQTLADTPIEGVVCRLYTGLLTLPAFVPDDTLDVPGSVAELHSAVAAADAVIFSTPEYAGTLPGSFKNLLDWTVGTGDLYGKPVGLVDVAAVGRGAGAMATLRSVLAYVGAEVVEAACVSVPVARDAVGLDGRIADPAIRRALTATAEALVASLHVDH